MTLFIVWSVIIAIYGITRYYQLGWNVTTSMPQRLWVMHAGDKDFKSGDYMMIKFHDFRMKNLNDFEYVVKQVGGIGGDLIMVMDWKGYAANENRDKPSLIYILPDGVGYPVFEKLSGNYFSPLTIKSMTIPNNCYFVHGQHHPTFDSRYKEFGLICESQIYGKAYPIF